MPHKVYGVMPSPPCRIVYTILDVVGEEFEDIPTPPGEATRTPEYLKMNNQHNVPTFVDADGFTLGDSRPIAVYLATRYDKTGKLYPNDPKVRAMIHHRLSFDAGCLYKAFFDLFVPVMFGGQKTPDESKKPRLKEVLGWLEEYVKPTGFIAGTHHATVADFVCMVSFSTIEVTKKLFVDLDEFPVAKEWAGKIKKLVPHYEKANNVQAYLDFFKLKSGLEV